MADTAAENFFGISNEALIDRYISKPLFLYLVEKLNLVLDLPRAQMLVAESVKLLLLIPLARGNAPISRELDEVWHYLILETKEYEKLCLSLPAQTFIHHRSVVFDKYEKPNPQSENFKDILKQRLSWFISYRNNFGPFSEQALPLWPIALEVMKDKKLSLDQFNSLLAL